MTVVTFAAQIISAGVVALLLFGFQRQYRKSYLRHWTSGWTALAVYHLASFAGFVLTFRYGASAVDPSRIAAAVLAAVAGYAQIGWFLFAPYELVRRRPIRMIVARRVLAALVVFAMITAVLFLDRTSFSITRNVARVGVHAFLGGTGFLIASIALWRARKRSAVSASRCLSTGYFFYAVEQLQYAFLTVSWAVAGEIPRYLNAHWLCGFSPAVSAGRGRDRLPARRRA